MGDGSPRILAERLYQLGFDILGSVRAITKGAYVLPHETDPVFHQALEQALKKSSEEIREQFNFLDLMIGRRCTELSDIMAIGYQRSLLTPTNNGHEFIVSDWIGLDIVREMEKRDLKRAKEIQAIAERLVNYLKRT